MLVEPHIYGETIGMFVLCSVVPLQLTQGRV